MHTIQTTDIIPVDLNCLLFHLEDVLLTGYQLKKDNNAIRLFTEKKNNRKKAIQKYCWNEASGFYFDYHFVQQASTERITMAGCFPLFTGIAETYQANTVATTLERKLLSAGGVLTTTATTGQQWDAPNGWAPLQWVAYKGLSNYGIHQLAEKIRQKNGCS